MTRKLTTYTELKEYISLFYRQEIDLLVITGKGGYGKTYEAKTAAPPESLYLGGHITPLAMYKRLYYYRDSPVVLDDIDKLTKDPRIRSIIKQTGDTYSTKTVQWGTTSNKLDGVPKEFSTTSNIMIIANDLSVKGLSEKALLSRGFVIEFEPTHHELLKRMQIVAKHYELEDTKKHEVLRFVTSRVSTAREANLRTLVKGFQLRAGTPHTWRSKLLRELDTDPHLVTVQRCLDLTDTVHAAEQHYTHTTGASRRTFYRHKQRLTET